MAAVLLAGLVTPLSSQAAGRGKNARLNSSRPAAAAVNAGRFTIVSTSCNTTAGMPSTMVVQPGTTGSAQVTVTISPTTSIVRRYDGKSNCTELSANDKVQIWRVRQAPAIGAPGATAPATPTTPLTAARIQDFSIQVAYTEIVGVITAAIASTTTTTPTVQLTVTVVANKGPKTSAFKVAQIITIDAPATTSVSIGKTTETAANLQVGQIIRANGLSDSVTSIMFAPRALRVIALNGTANVAPASAADASDQ
jgi:hypothetical protein